MDAGIRAVENRSPSPQSRWRRGVAIVAMIPCILACVSKAESAKTRQYLLYPGDIILAGLFPVHGKGQNDEPCGKIQMDVGMQPLEAMLFTIKQINDNTSFLPGIKLGMVGFDTCDNVAYGLKHSFNFAKAVIAHKNEYHVREFQCSDNSTPTYNTREFDNVVAVIGPQSSSVAQPVASLLTLLEVPQVSCLATAPFLSEEGRFPYFFRTVPSDVERVRAMLEMLRKFNWTYISFVYSDNTYGRQGQEILTDLAKNYSICFASQHRIDTDETTEYKKILGEMSKTKNLKVVIVFADKKKTEQLLVEAHSERLKKRFLWIISDTWVASEEVHMSLSKSLYKGDPKDHYKDVLEGALAIQPLVADLKGFDTYFKSLTRAHEADNPWFKEFWMEYFNCGKTLKDSEPIDVNETSDKAYDDRCGAGTSRDMSLGPFKKQYYLHLVRDAVYAVAHALKDMQASLCDGEAEVCRNMKHIDGAVFKDFLRNVSFPTEYGTEFKFINRGGPPRYSILNFQRNKNGHLQWIVVGNYTHVGNGDPELNVDENKLVKGSTIRFNNTCQPSCAHNQVKIRKNEESCCWSCSPCDMYEFRSDNDTCVPCKVGEHAAPDHASCVPVSEQFIDFSCPWVITIVCFAGVGMLLTVVVAGVYWLYGDTPLIKASGREMSYLLLGGIFASFITSIIIVSKPTEGTCGCARFLVGFCLTFCYAAIVTKTNRIARIFTQKSSQVMDKLRYISPQSQLVITALLTLVEVIINVSWLTFVPPEVVHKVEKDIRARMCRGFENHSCLVSLLYPFVLIAICTVYAFMTRKCPDGFNETKHIAFTNYTTIIIWLTFVPFYVTSQKNEFSVTSLSLSTSVSALVQLACLFFPKLYIVVLQPHKNTKECVMASHRSVIYLPHQKVYGRSCSHQGSSSKESDLNNSVSTQDNKKSFPPVTGNNLYSRYRCKPDNVEIVQSKDMEDVSTEDIRDRV